MARLTSARRLRKEVLDEWDLSPVEVRILDDMCHEAELISRMAKELDGGDLLTVGSTGQMRPNPLLAEIRQHRAVMASLAKALRLQDDTDEARLARSEHAATAAAWRWGLTHGTSA